MKSQRFSPITFFLAFFICLLVCFSVALVPYEPAGLGDLDHPVREIYLREGPRGLFYAGCQTPDECAAEWNAQL